VELVLALVFGFVLGGLATLYVVGLTAQVRSSEPRVSLVMRAVGEAIDAKNRGELPAAAGQPKCGDDAPEHLALSGIGDCDRPINHTGAHAWHSEDDLVDPKVVWE
jgi:hypothetical protein